LRAFTHSAEYYEVLTNAEARLAREGPLLDACLNEAPGRRIPYISCSSVIYHAMGVHTVTRGLRRSYDLVIGNTSISAKGRFPYACLPSGSRSFTFS